MGCTRLDLPIALLVLCLLLCDVIDDCVEARRAAQNQEDSLISIKTKFGDIYDCVDIYKQPAFSHPLLKNHKIQMRHRSRSSFVRDDSESRDVKDLHESCPKGTVAIPRRKKHDMEMTRSQTVKDSGVGYEFAGVYLRPDAGKTYQGVGAELNVYKPPVGSQQLSSSIVQVAAGSPGNTAYIRIGWLVDPDMYHDDQPRAFIEWQESKNGKVTGCYNVDCPGFIVTSNEPNLGYVLPNTSIVDGPQYYQEMVLFKDHNQPTWYVYLSSNLAPVGYYPNELFSTGLENGADEAFFGGMVYSATTSFPQMGSGQYNGGVYGEDCFTQKVSIIEEIAGTISVYPPNNPNLITLHPTHCFRTEYNPHFDDQRGFTLFFGGEGGDISNQCL